nr:hypothetical protein CFP56_74947 [Quercus suber]
MSTGLSHKRASMVVFESPSSTMEVKAKSRASLRALPAAITSTVVIEKGKGNASAMEATTCPFQSQIMTPTPACYSPWKTTSSKLTLKFGQGGSFHLMFWWSLVVPPDGFG